MMKLGVCSNKHNLFPNLEAVRNYYLLKEAPLEVVDLNYAEVNSLLKDKEIDCKYIRVSVEASVELFSSLTVQPENVKFLGLFDCFIFENGSWIPRLFYFECLRSLFIKKFKNHKINEAAAIICGNGELSAFVNFVVGLGHQRIIIFNEEGQLPENCDIKKHIIGVDYSVVKFSELTQVNIDTSLMINTIDLEKNSLLLNDLAYFNFMSQGSAVIELYSNSPVNPFLFEAEKAGLRTMHRKEVVTNFDYLTLLKLGLISPFEKDNFFQEYSEIMTID